jgi:hypothetical protein
VQACRLLQVRGDRGADLLLQHRLQRRGVRLEDERRVVRVEGAQVRGVLLREVFEVELPAAQPPQPRERRP